MSEPEHRLPWQDLGPPYRIIKVRALPGGLEESTAVPATFATRKQAAHSAERVQAGCFEACDPVQVYVTDKTGARVFRAQGDWALDGEERTERKVRRPGRAA